MAAMSKAQTAVPPLVLHLETALIYSGSTAVLQRFLERCDLARFHHNVLFRWPHDAGAPP